MLHFRVAVAMSCRAAACSWNTRIQSKAGEGALKCQGHVDHRGRASRIAGRGGRGLSQATCRYGCLRHRCARERLSSLELVLFNANRFRCLLTELAIYFESDRSRYASLLGPASTGLTDRSVKYEHRCPRLTGSRN
jgi:hypothetical protein